MSGHFQPVALHRHHKRASPARLDNRGLIDEILGSNNKGADALTTSLETLVQTLALPQTTILHTEVVPVVAQAQPTTDSKATEASTSPSATAAAASANTQTPASASNSSSNSDTSSSSGTSSSSSAAAPSASSVVSTSSSSTNAAPPSSTPAVVAQSATPTITHASVATHASSASSSARPSSTALDATGAAAQHHSGLSGGAIAGIVIVVILAVCALAVFIVRKTLLRRRQNRRMTWNPTTFPKPEQQSDMFNEKMNNGGLPPVPEKPFVAPIVALPPPPMSYNNPAPVNVMSPTLTPALGAPAVTLTPAGSNIATVRCTFVPNLPDELSITAGETIRILNEYDDGWALCANERGEQGVVPVECFVRTTAAMPGRPMYPGQGTGDWRMSRRASSLNGAVSNMPRY